MQNLSNGQTTSGRSSPLPHGTSSGFHAASPAFQQVANGVPSQMYPQHIAALSPSQIQAAASIYTALQQIQAAHPSIPSNPHLAHIAATSSGKIPQNHLNLQNPSAYPSTMTNPGIAGSYYVPTPSPAAPQQPLNNPMALASLLHQYQQSMLVNGAAPEASLGAFNYGISNSNNSVMPKLGAHHHPSVPSPYAAAQALASILQQSQGVSKAPIVQQQQQQQQHYPPLKSFATASSHPSLSNQTSSLSLSEAMQTETTDSEQVSMSDSHDVASSTKVKKVSPKRKLPKKLNAASRSGASTTSSSSAHPSLPYHHHHHHHHLPTNTPGYPSICNKSIPPLIMSEMQKQSLSELEQHVKLLMDMNHPVPNQVWMLLQEQRLIEEKKLAKRLINRKSASSSRARKKKLVEEMMLNNAKLRRQANILSLLPDLVIAIKPDGEITFCSGQVERILSHKVVDMIGANISSIITPPSREALNKLIEKLLASEKVASDDGNNESGRSSNSGNTSGAPMVSEQSDHGFPLSIVKVNSFKGATDASGDTKQSSDLVSPSPTSQTKDDTEVSDRSNLSTANEALDRNVRSHNELLKKQKESKKQSSSHKDDVTGDTVTANNASARLSSLLQPPESNVKKTSSDDNLEDNASSSSSDSLLGGVEDKRHKKRKSPENISDDSGYREDSGSSTSETSNSGRKGTSVPTCSVCLIREDLSTIWCEVTSSLRTMLSDEDFWQDAQTTSSQDDKTLKADASQNSDDQKMRSSAKPVVELLLCIRPLRDSSEKVSEELRFLPKKTLLNSDHNLLQRSDSGTKHSITEGASSSSKSTSSTAPENEVPRPMKKRKPPLSPNEDVREDTQDAIESLIQMSNTKA